MHDLGGEIVISHGTEAYPVTSTNDNTIVFQRIVFKPLEAMKLVSRHCVEVPGTKWKRSFLLLTEAGRDLVGTLQKGQSLIS